MSAGGRSGCKSRLQRAAAACLAALFLLTAPLTGVYAEDGETGSDAINTLDRSATTGTQAEDIWGVTKVDLSSFLYFEYDLKGRGSDYFFYGAGMLIDWKVPNTMKAGDYFELELPPEIYLDVKPDPNRIIFTIKDKDTQEDILHMYKMNDNTLRFVATDYVERYFNVRGAPVLGMRSSVMIGTDLNNSYVKSITGYNTGGRQMAKDYNQFEGYRFVDGFRPNKALFKSTDGSARYRGKVSYISKYQNSPAYILEDETDIDYSTERQDTYNRKFGRDTIYAVEEGDDYIIWELIHNAIGDSGAGSLEISFVGFASNRPVMAGQLGPTNGGSESDGSLAYGKKTVELYDKKLGKDNIYTGTSFDVWEGDPSGAMVPNNLRRPTGIYIINEDTSPEKEGWGNGTRYTINFKDGSYFVRIKTRKRKMIKDPWGRDAYKVSLKRNSGGFRYHVEEFYSPNTGYGAGTGEAILDVREVERGTVYVEHWAISNGTKTVLKKGVAADNVPVGTHYETSSETFPGYTYSRVAGNSAPVSGDVEKGERTVIYLYTPDTAGNVYEIHKDINTGEVLSPRGNGGGSVDFGGIRVTPVKEGAPIGEKYTTSVKPSGLLGSAADKNKYRFVRMGDDSAPAEGYVKPGSQLVTYLYEVVPADAKTGNVYVNHVAIVGTKRIYLKDTELVLENAPIGSPYETHEEKFDEYDFFIIDQRGAPQNGTVTAEDKIVTFVYKPKPKQSVTVTKKWQNGTESAVTVRLYKDGNPTEETAELSEANGWQHTFADLPVQEEGVTVEYTIREAGTRREASGKSFVVINGNRYEVTTEGTMAQGYTLTNTYTPPPSVLPSTGVIGLSLWQVLFALLGLGFGLMVYLANRSPDSSGT